MHIVVFHTHAEIIFPDPSWMQFSMYESLSSIRTARKQYLRFEIARFEAITSTLALITEVPVSSACHYRLQEELM